MVKNLPAMQKTKVWFLGQEIHWRREWLPTPVFLPGKSMDRGAWWATVLGVPKSRTWLSDWHFNFLLQMPDWNPLINLTAPVFLCYPIRKTNGVLLLSHLLLPVFALRGLFLFQYACKLHLCCISWCLLIVCSIGWWKPLNPFLQSFATSFVPFCAHIRAGKIIFLNDWNVSL